MKCLIPWTNFQHEKAIYDNWSIMQFPQFNDPLNQALSFLPFRVLLREWQVWSHSQLKVRRKLKQFAVLTFELILGYLYLQEQRRRVCGGLWREQERVCLVWCWGQQEGWSISPVPPWMLCRSEQNGVKVWMDSLIPRGGLRGGWRGALEMKGAYQIKSASLEKQPVYLPLDTLCCKRN